MNAIQEVTDLRMHLEERRAALVQRAREEPSGHKSQVYTNGMIAGIAEALHAVALLQQSTYRPR